MEDDEIIVYPEIEDALMGVTMNSVNVPDKAVYSFEKCIDIFMSRGLSYEEAREHVEINFVGAYVGEGTPVFVMEDYNG
jgi:hypothetical protein